MLAQPPLAEVFAATRVEWRQWLTEHHLSSRGVWLVYYKIASRQPSVRYPEAVQEALCFGWIDSKVQRLDADRYRQLFTPRQPGSVWSKLNKQFVAELCEQGQMTAAGLAKIAAAQQDGSWSALDAIEALMIPPDLAQALAANATADRYFAAFSNSQKKAILTWIASAKRAETRANRLRQTVASAEQNQSPLGRSPRACSRRTGA